MISSSTITGKGSLFKNYSVIILSVVRKFLKAILRGFKNYSVIILFWWSDDISSRYSYLKTTQLLFYFPLFLIYVHIQQFKNYSVIILSTV